MVESSSNPLTEPMDIQELAIILSAKNINPTILTLANLRSLGIIPEEWELVDQPVINQLQARLNFKNGVNIIAQPQKVTIAESLNNDNNQSRATPSLAKEFVTKFAKASYQTISIAPKMIVTFGQQQTISPRQFIIENLINSGPWLEIGKQTPQASVNFVYQLETCQLNLNINEVQLTSRNQPNQAVAGLLFSGSFNYAASQNDQEVTQLQNQINNWSDNLETFREIVQQKFLGENNSGIFPSQIMP